MFIPYDLAFLILASAYLPIYLFKRKFHRGLLARMGILPRDIALGSPIWVHAVSVGEVKAVSGLIRELIKKYPQKKIVISTVTATGNQIARSLLKPEEGLVTYLPLDFSFIVRRVLNKIRPSFFIIAETEIWPNLITELSRRKIPICVVNGRISDRSFKGYQLVRLFIQPLLRRVDKFCVQTKQDAERLIKLGVAEFNISIVGNLKFDIPISTRLDAGGEKTKLGLKPFDKLLVAGSTHPGEEPLLLDVYRELIVKFPDLALLIAPRHPERSGDIKDEISRSGFCSVFISKIGSTKVKCLSKPIFILDVMGMLNNLYALADIVFIGGSLVRKGGHNILEPAAEGKPILFGPHMFNFRDIAGIFLADDAALMVGGRDELKSALIFLLENEVERERMSNKAKSLLIKHQGATTKTVQEIVSLYKV